MSRNDGGDRFERHTQLIGNYLPVGREGRPLPEVALSRTNQDSVVRMDFNPRTAESRVERVLECCGFRRVALGQEGSMPSAEDL